MGKPRIKIASVFYKNPSVPVKEQKFKEEHVYRMYEQIRDNTTKKFDFYCLTNIDELSHPNIKTIKLDDTYKGWFAKMRLFDPKIFASGRIFYIDLDMSILKNIDDILTFQGDLCMCKDAHYEAEYWSNIILFDAAKCHFIYKNFKQQEWRTTMSFLSSPSIPASGDQNWINALCSTKTGSDPKTQKIKDLLALPPQGAYFLNSQSTPNPLPRKHLIVDLPSQWFPSAKKRKNDRWELINLDDLSPEAKILVYHGEPAPWEREKYK